MERFALEVDALAFADAISEMVGYDAPGVPEGVTWIEGSEDTNVQETDADLVTL